MRAIVRLFAYALMLAATLFFLAIAALAFLNKDPKQSFGKCQMRSIETSIPKEKMDQYLDACMVSAGFKLSFKTCNFSIDRGHWCYLSTRVFWAN